MCPCQHDDSEFTVALLVCAGAVFLVLLLRKHWARLPSVVRIAGVVVIAGVVGGGFLWMTQKTQDTPVCTVACATQPDSAPTSAPAATRPVTAERPLKVIAYYFHRTMRCPSCLKIEDYSRQAIEAEFSGLLTDGTVEWRPVNVDLAEHKHYVDDFQLETQTLVLVKQVEGQSRDWKKLESVWDLLDQPAGFFQYVQNEMSMCVYGVPMMLPESKDGEDGTTSPEGNRS